MSGNKGLSDIELIISEAKKYLSDGGWLLIEHGYQQADAVRTLLNNEGYSQISTQRDMAGHERLALACLKI